MLREFPSFSRAGKMASRAPLSSSVLPSRLDESLLRPAERSAFGGRGTATRGVTGQPRRLVRVYDPDGKITTWDQDEEDVIASIEKDGSVDAYLTAQRDGDLALLSKFEGGGFRISDADKVRHSARVSGFGNTDAALLYTMIDMYFDDVTVVGEVDGAALGRGGSPNWRECFVTLHSKMFKYDLRVWMDSLKEVALKRGQNCFLLAHHSVDVTTMLRELFPGFAMFNQGNISIPLRKLTDILRQ